MIIPAGIDVPVLPANALPPAQAVLSNPNYATAGVLNDSITMDINAANAYVYGFESPISSAGAISPAC